MPNHPNFLLGYGERLVEPIDPVPGGAEKVPPYSFADAKNRLIPFLTEMSRELAELPRTACPQNEAVGVLTLHPQYLAKSYFPGMLLASLGLDAVGSRPTEVKPDRWTRKEAPRLTPSTDLFIAGNRENFDRWASSITRWAERTPGAEDLIKVERLRAMRPEDRIRPVLSSEEEPVLEVVLHASASRGSSFILEGFAAHLATMNLRPDFDRRFYTGGLCFLPLQAPKQLIEKIAAFSFLRVVREMPRIRTLRPITRGFRASSFLARCPRLE